MCTRAIEAALARLSPDFGSARYCVAFSGGLDSTALLHGMTQLRAAHPVLGLRAIHIHHHLLPEADAWAGHCLRMAERLAVPFTTLDVDVKQGPGVSTEAAAREARYAALAGALQPGEILLTAHHQDDQLETVLLQLMRGAGVAGLSAMPADAPFGPGRHQRPLLEAPRAELEAALRAAGLDWVEDTSNAWVRHDRNYLRLIVLPLLRERCPAIGANAGRTARHMAEAQSLLEDLARIDLGDPAPDNSLDLKSLQALPAARARNLLRYWIRRAGHRPPSTVKLNEILRQMMDSRPDAHPRVAWDGVQVSRRRGRLYLGPAGA